MSDSENGDSLSDINQFRLSMHNSFQSDYGLSREVLETLTIYSVSSPGWLSDDIRALEDECRDDEALLNESLGRARVAQLQALANRQRSRLDEAELDIAAYNQHQSVAENVNSALADRLAGITSVHVLVCLERDRLRSFRRVAIYVILVLVIMMLLGFIVYVGRVMHM